MVFILTLSVPAAAESIPIRLNTVGYLPRAEKWASIASPGKNFAVSRVAAGSTVFKGNITGPVLDPDTQEQLYTADFSALNQPGEYQLDIPDAGRSAPFRVAADVYREPFHSVMLGFYLWRCGTAVSATYRGQTFAHGSCHTNDAWLDYVGGGHTRMDGTQGWHDAGDYNKYVVNAGATVGVMFRAAEVLQSGTKTARLSESKPRSTRVIPAKWEWRPSRDLIVPALE